MSGIPPINVSNIPVKSQPPAPPSSPAGPATFQPFDCVRRLTHFQVKKGWREAFSSNENRPYYYNIFTHDSVWSIPEALPIRPENGQPDSGPTPDLLAAAMADLNDAPFQPLADKETGCGEDDKTGANYPAAGDQVAKRKFLPDPDQEENDRKAVKFFLGDEDEELMETQRRVRSVIKSILTKIVTDQIFNLAFKAQQQLGCEGCEEDWPSQYDHACMFYGYTPECRLRDFVHEHYDDAIKVVDATKVRLVFGLVTSRLGVGPFTYEGMNLENVIGHIFEEWKSDPEDLSVSFYSNALNMLTELIHDAIQRLRY